jgi:DNA-binding helix-hairpin-helix protein with protein kinase domain
MKNSDKQAGNRTVWDAKETRYDLTGKIGEGGQGMVCTTQYANVLVKVSKRATKDPRTIEWFKHISWIARQPLDGLHIARPQSLIVKPRLGYVMELMDGLEPMKLMLESSLTGLRDGNGVSTYLQSGGMSRRIRILARLARSLALLHGRALAYGDLSPANIFVSKAHQYSEVWLIDCDNLSVLSHEGGQKVYTPDYGAPEILRNESGINSLTDSWSFAVIAFQLLSMLHPLKGDMVNDGTPELEDAALHGELPWIDHPGDERNRTINGLPRDQILTKRLREYFEQCFNAGLSDPEARPSLAAWAEAFEAASMLMARCDPDLGCGNAFLFNARRECPFCGHIQARERVLILKHYVHATLAELGDEAKEKDQWLRTSDLQLVDLGEPVDLHSSPVGSSTYSDSPIVCRLDLSKDGLWIEPTSSAPLFLQREKNKKIEKVRLRTLLKAEWKQNLQLALHIGDLDKLHTAWRFEW